MAHTRSIARIGILFLALASAACGTTHVTDTPRSATEQLLISDSVDEAVSEIDVSSLAGKPVYFDPQYLDGVVDKGYVISSLRQHLLANGCYLVEDRAKATYVVEARAGAVGTDRSEVLFGVPQLNVPSVVPGQPSGSVPEIPLAKKTNRRGVAKIAVFAYNRTTGRPLFQSGLVQKTSSARDTWVLGAGPFVKGTLYAGSEGDTQLLPGQLWRAPEGTSREPVEPLIPVVERVVWQEEAAPCGEPGRLPAMQGPDGASAPMPVVERGSAKTPPATP